MEQRNYSHGKFSPFDNLPYRLVPRPGPITACIHASHLLTHTHTHTHEMSCHAYCENYTSENKENAGLCFNPRGNIRCQTSSSQ